MVQVCLRPVAVLCAWHKACSGRKAVLPPEKAGNAPGMRAGRALSAAYALPPQRERVLPESTFEGKRHAPGAFRQDFASGPLCCPEEAPCPAELRQIFCRMRGHRCGSLLSASSGLPGFCARGVQWKVLGRGKAFFKKLSPFPCKTVYPISEKGMTGAGGSEGSARRFSIHTMPYQRPNL